MESWETRHPGGDSDQRGHDKKWSKRVPIAGGATGCLEERGARPHDVIASVHESRVAMSLRFFQGWQRPSMQADDSPA